MAQFILVPDGQVENFKGNAKRDGETLLWKAINPISVKTPPNRSVLPVRVLDDEDIKEAFPALDALPQENESEIEFWEYDEEGNVIN